MLSNSTPTYFSLFCVVVFFFFVMILINVVYYSSFPSIPPDLSHIPSFIRSSFHCIPPSHLCGPAVRALEKVKGLQGSYTSSDSGRYTNPKGSTVSAFDGGSGSSSESEPEEPPTRKKLRAEAS